ncbi:hypothetical protein [Natrarchaeobius halalkaliphilus]|uniref:hypothetical protein n=1 Tax=Natrarchaeobius halalkaliphilus TaxID=1679091 RepID=UPI0014052F15|nr:hypothetical protein [Natrarchaeobius halalkaliphilus]
MATTSPEKRRTIGVCERCGKPTVVWVHPDGSVRSVSGHNACPCPTPSFRPVRDG